MAQLAGKSGNFTVGASAWELSEWTMDMATEAVDITNFNSGGYREVIAGLTDAKITARGPFNSTAMALTSGTSYSLVLAVSGSVSYSVTALVTNIKLVTEVSKAVMVEVSAVSNGSFTASIA
jgi:predicted secreted protein